MVEQQQPCTCSHSPPTPPHPRPLQTASVFSHCSHHLPFPTRLLLTHPPDPPTLRQASSLLCPFCFNSSLITSHVPHQVLISSLLLRVWQTRARARALTLAEECTCTRPKPQILVLPTVVCQRVHAFLKRLLCGCVLSFKHAIP